jgi:hypothetical protein
LENNCVAFDIGEVFLKGDQFRPILDNRLNPVSDVLSFFDAALLMEVPVIEAGDFTACVSIELGEGRIGKNDFPAFPSSKNR